MNDVHEVLKEVLRGYGRGAILRLDSLASIDNWPAVAAKELERRATRVVEVLDDKTLEAIASGDLNVEAVCRELAAEM